MAAFKFPFTTLPVFVNKIETTDNFITYFVYFIVTLIQVVYFLV
jgi:hypothetical protein